MRFLTRPFYVLGRLFSILAEYSQDVFSFVYHNAYSPFADRSRRSFYRLVIETHTIEKGLSLAEPRPMFGRAKVSSVLSALARFDASASAFPVRMADGALRDYRDFNIGGGAADPLLDDVGRRLEPFAGDDRHFTGGVKRYPRQEGANEAAIAFLMARSSVRMFDPAPLPADLVERIIRVAQQAPSQCNRQATRVHFYQNPEMVRALLELQGGSRGFSHSVGNLFVVTNEISAWGGPQQRNQLYVDGALFAMSLMLAVHAHGLVSCPLNLAVTNRVEREIKRVGEIAPAERTIMMVAIGKPAEGDLRVARSPRRDLSEIARIHA